VGYDCVVMVKQVPDTKAVTAKAMKEDGTVNRAALPAIYNPEDLNALEAALDIKDLYGGTVTVITMGPPAACEILRESLYRGADKVALISDRRAAASDTLATSYILNCAARSLPHVDLVLCGRQAIDGDTAQVGPQLAEKLGFPQVTYMESLMEMTNNHIVVKRNVGNGWEIVRSKLPALVTVVDTANIPRPPAAKLVMKYKKARGPAEITREIAGEKDPASDPALKAQIDQKIKDLRAKGLLIEQWNLDDIKADLQWCGRSGSPTKVHRIQAVVLKGTGHKQFAPNDTGVRDLIHNLIEERTLG
jgi:electron transfer flavoprotein beta subunit